MATSESNVADVSAPPPASAEGSDHKCCVTGHAHAGDPVGVEEEVAGFPCYIARASPCTGRAVVIATDIFGWKLVNARLVADQFAAAGFDCYIPDTLLGQAFAPDSMDFMKPSNSTLTNISNTLTAVVTIPGLVVWMGRHSPDVMLPRFAAVIDEIKTKRGATAVAVQGYCFGGRHAIMLAAGASSAITAYAAAHPSRVTVPDELTATTKPGIYLLAEVDRMFTAADITALRKVAVEKAAAGVEMEVKVYKDVAHGFAVRGDMSNPAVAAAKADALQETIAFFNKHMPIDTATTTTISVDAPEPAVTAGAGAV